MATPTCNLFLDYVVLFLGLAWQLDLMLTVPFSYYINYTVCCNCRQLTIRLAKFLTFCVRLSIFSPSRAFCLQGKNFIFFPNCHSTKISIQIAQTNQESYENERDYL